MHVTNASVPATMLEACHGIEFVVRADGRRCRERIRQSAHLAIFAPVPLRVRWRARAPAPRCSAAGARARPHADSSGGGPRPGGTCHEGARWTAGAGSAAPAAVCEARRGIATALACGPCAAARRGPPGFWNGTLPRDPSGGAWGAEADGRNARKGARGRRGRADPGSARGRRGPSTCAALFGCGAGSGPECVGWGEGLLQARFRGCAERRAKFCASACPPARG